MRVAKYPNVHSCIDVPPNIIELLDKYGHTLMPKYYDVVSMKLGYMQKCNFSFQEIGEIYGVTRSRISQIFYKGIRQLILRPKMFEHQKLSKNDSNP